MGPSPWIKTQAAASSLGFYPTSWSADLKSSVEQHSDWKAAETDAHGYWVLKKKKVVPVCYVNGQRSIEYHSCNLTCHGNWYHLISWYSSYCIVRNVAVCIWRGFFFFFALKDAQLSWCCKLRWWLVLLDLIRCYCCQCTSEDPICAGQFPRRPVENVFDDCLLVLSLVMGRLMFSVIFYDR